MSIRGRTGADAMAIALAHMCRVYLAYSMKLRAKVQEQIDTATITTEQGEQIYAFLDQLNTTCMLMRIIADNSGF